MFFLLSKTLGVLLLPTNFLILLGLAGLILLATRCALLGRGLLVASLRAARDLRVLAAGVPAASCRLKVRFPPGMRHEAHLTALWCSAGQSTPTFRRRMACPSWAVRLTALSLAQRSPTSYPSARLVFTGGSSNLYRERPAGSRLRRGAFPSGSACPANSLTIERRSRNTEENAEFTKGIAAPKDSERWLLVTSAYHMPRSVGLFRKAGFRVEPYPVDWRIGPRADLRWFSPIAAEGLQRTELAVHEWLGLFAYWLTGKTRRFLPGPEPE